ncbi:MAG: hypothetical protein AB1423_12495 [Pseudomonadota bacterium]
MLYQNIVEKIILLFLISFLLSIFVLLISSILYYLITHNKGIIKYIIKTTLVGLITIPIAIIITPAIACYLIWKKLTLPIWNYLFPIDKKITIKEINEIDSDKIIVHLVHGTFEPNAQWTQPDSDMYKEIKKSNKNIEIYRFVWDGKNSVSSRKYAATQLLEQIKDSPSNINYIVAHSHGAAIVKEMSYLQPEIARKVQGVCLLSPPFIYCRKIKRTSGKLLNLMEISGSMAIQFFLATILTPFGLYNVNLAVIILIISMLLEKKLSRKYKKEFMQEVREIENEDGQYSINFRNVEIFHAIGDEADSALRFVSVLHEWCFSILSQLNKGQEKRRELINWSATISYLFYISASIISWILYPGNKCYVIIFLFSFTFTVISHINQYAKPSKDTPHALIIAAIPVSILSFWLSLAKAIAYGDLRLIFCPEIFIATSETPVGSEHNVLKFAPLNDSILMHSTHSHPDAIRNVAAWLESSEFERNK